MRPRKIQLSKRQEMNAQFEIADFNQIANTLSSMIDPFMVDDVNFFIDQETNSAVASFACNEYGHCIVKCPLPADEETVPLKLLRIMVKIAHRRLEPMLIDSAWGAVCDVDRSTPEKRVPRGFTMEFKPILN
jgi:hypothetical protein